MFLSFLCVFGFFPVQVALGNDYVAQVDKHSSQKDASKGFGGKFGVEKDRVDKVGTQLQDMCKQLHVTVLTIQEIWSFKNGLALSLVRHGLWVQRRSGATHISERLTHCSTD